MSRVCDFEALSDRVQQIYNMFDDRFLEEDKNSLREWLKSLPKPDAVANEFGEYEFTFSWTRWGLCLSIQHQLSDNSWCNKGP